MGARRRRVAGTGCVGAGAAWELVAWVRAQPVLLHAPIAMVARYRSGCVETELVETELVACETARRWRITTPMVTCGLAQPVRVTPVRRVVGCHHTRNQFCSMQPLQWMRGREMDACDSAQPVHQPRDQFTGARRPRNQFSKGQLRYPPTHNRRAPEGARRLCLECWAGPGQLRRSSTIAIPMPPPTHIVSTPKVLS